MGKYDRYGSDIKRALREGNQLYAIKIYAQRTGCGLKLAKDYIDTVKDRYLPKHST